MSLLFSALLSLSVSQYFYPPQKEPWIMNNDLYPPTPAPVSIQCLMPFVVRKRFSCPVLFHSRVASERMDGGEIGRQSDKRILMIENCCHFISTSFFFIESGSVRIGREY